MNYKIKMKCTQTVTGMIEDYCTMYSQSFRYNLMYLFYFLDGRPQWEVEAKVIREKSQGVSSHLFSCINLTLINWSFAFLFY